MMETVKGKLLWPIVFMVALAGTRWPGLLPWNFSAVYALMFCAGVYLPRWLAWWLPFLTVFLTDLGLNAYYYHITPVRPEMVGNYLSYAALVGLGRCFSPKSSFLALLGGGLLGAFLFYLITNTFSWFFNAQYAKSLAGWLIALTRGTEGWPQTWEFFRNNLLSGGLFTALFAGAMKLMEPAEKMQEAEEAEETEAPEEQPEEAQA